MSAGNGVTPHRKPVPPVGYRWKPGQRAGLARYIRRLTGDGAELVDFMAAVMRDDVARVYTLLAARDLEQQRARRDEKVKALRAKVRGTTAQKRERVRKIAALLAAPLVPRVPLTLPIHERRAALAWLANRAFGKAPLVVKLEDGRPAKLNLSALSDQQLEQLAALLDAMEAAQPPVLEMERAETESSVARCRVSHGLPHA